MTVEDGIQIAIAIGGLLGLVAFLAQIRLFSIDSHLNEIHKALKDLAEKGKDDAAKDDAAKG